jgi:hypothetical protein
MKLWVPYFSASWIIVSLTKIWGILCLSQKIDKEPDLLR